MLMAALILAGLFAWGWIRSIRYYRRLKKQNLALAEQVAALKDEAGRLSRRWDRTMIAGKEAAEERVALKKENLALAERVAQQSELLSKAAEREQEAARRLGYLFPRGLETPPSVEDALSPTWCRQEPKSGIGYRPPSAEEFDELVAAFREAPDALPREAV